MTCAFKKIIVKLYLFGPKKSFSGRVGTILLTAKTHYKHTCIFMLFHLLFISMTKSVYNDFKATIQKYTIQINIKMKIKISIKYVFFDIVRPITHQAVQKSSKHICRTACCVIIGPTICKNKRSMLKSARYLDYYPFDYM